MKLLDTLKRSSRNLKHAKVRTFLTASAIAVGGFTLTLTLAAATGARSYANRLISANTSANSVFVAKDESLFGSGNTKPQEYSDDLASVFGALFKQLTPKDIANLQGLPHVKSVLENYDLSAQFVTRDGAKKYTGALYTYDSAQKPTMKIGTALESVKPGTVLLSDDYIALLKFKSPEDAVGKQVTVQVR